MLRPLWRFTSIFLLVALTHASVAHANSKINALLCKTVFSAVKNKKELSLPELETTLQKILYLNIKNKKIPDGKLADFVNGISGANPKSAVLQANLFEGDEEIQAMLADLNVKYDEVQTIMHTDVFFKELEHIRDRMALYVGASYGFATFMLVPSMLYNWHLFPLPFVGAALSTQVIFSLLQGNPLWFEWFTKKWDWDRKNRTPSFIITKLRGWLKRKTALNFVQFESELTENMINNFWGKASTEQALASQYLADTAPATAFNKQRYSSLRNAHGPVQFKQTYFLFIDNGKKQLLSISTTTSPE